MAARNSGERSLANLISELWWLWVVQAVLAVLFGLVAVLWPGLTLTVLVYLLGVFVLLIGVTEVVRGLMSLRINDSWWMTLVVGLLLLGAGVYLARHPGVSFATFVVVVGIMFLVWGIMYLVRGFLDDQTSGHKVLNFITGLAALAAGIFTFFQPVKGGVAFVWAYGVFALVYGIAALVMAIEHHRDYADARAALRG